MAARSAFAFGTDACDDLRETHLIFLLFRYNNLGTTVRECFKPVDIRLVDKATMSDQEAFDEVRQLQKRGLAQKTPNNVIDDAVSFYYMISILTTPAARGGTNIDSNSESRIFRCSLACTDKLSRFSLLVYPIPITLKLAYSTFIGYAAGKLNPDWAGTLFRWLDNPRRPVGTLVIEDLVLSEGEAKARELVENASDKVEAAYRRFRVEASRCFCKEWEALR